MSRSTASFPRTGDRRRLIVNADDFGLSEGVNRGIVRAHEEGIVTSASLMVRGPAAAGAADDARRHPRLSVGLHLDLGEWVCRDGLWSAMYEVVPLDDAATVRAEVGWQLARFREIMRRDPTHIDSHQHVHRSEPLRSIALGVSGELGVPLRHFASGVEYCGAFYGQTTEGTAVPEAIGVEALLSVLDILPPGTTELCCHPGLDDGLETMYRRERFVEVETLCDRRVRRSLAATAVDLASFSDVASDLRQARVHRPHEGSSE